MLTKYFFPSGEKTEAVMQGLNRGHILGNIPQPNELQISCADLLVKKVEDLNQFPLTMSRHSIRNSTKEHTLFSVLAFSESITGTLNRKYIFATCIQVSSLLIVCICRY